MDRSIAFDLLKKYNQDMFHLRHALTVEAVMRYFALRYGYESDADFWATVGLLHDIDFELFPDQHCQKAPDLLKEIDAPDEMVHAICSHGYTLCSDVAPVHFMEKILFAVDELTGLIGACALMRPSKSTKDMELSSLKKKFKDKKFAAGCSRDVIQFGSTQLSWELEQLLLETLEAMQACEDTIQEEYTKLTQK